VKEVKAATAVYGVRATLQRAQSVILDATVSSDLSGQGRTTSEKSHDLFVPRSRFYRRAPAAMSERGERGWAKLYLTRRVKGRSLARARVPDYNARTWFLIRRRMSVVGFAEMCIASCCIEEVCAR